MIAYHTYGKFLARKIFKLRPDAGVPSKQLNDGIDYVPTKKGIVFGHHFTSIAGTGPIVGPAVGVIWGWLPAILWIVLGSIFMGAVHDFGALIISLRNEGKSISEVAAKYINKRVRFLFFIIVFFVLLIVIAVFGLVIASVFSLYPESVIAVWLEIPIAVVLGYVIYKKKFNVNIATILAVGSMYVAVVLGAWLEHIQPGLTSIPDMQFMPATGTWTIILLVYAWVASTLPVTALLQPRDYINAWQLFIMMALLTVGVFFASFSGVDFGIAAPAVNKTTGSIPPLLPMMFVTIACGAISGFHSLVSGGTSPKQLSSESDSLFVGYGSMLTEGGLAVLVIICVAAGIALGKDAEAGRAVWDGYYSSWLGAKGLGGKLEPVVNGAANIMSTIGVPGALGLAIMGVFISSFAGTTLDTAVRVQRYVISEMAEDFKLPKLKGRYAATTIAVLSAAGLAFATGANGKGALKLWPLFGTVNQLLAALTLLVATMYLRKKGGLKFIFTAVPCLVILVITIWAMVITQRRFIARQEYLLITIGGAVMLLAVWMVIETVIVFFRKGGVQNGQTG